MVRQSAVKPEFGPPLPALLRPWLAGLPSAVRAVLALVALVFLGAALWVVVDDPPQPEYVQREPIVFNFRCSPRLAKIAPTPPELVRVEERRAGLFIQSFSVETLRLPPYTSIDGSLPRFLIPFIERERRRYRDFVLPEESPARVNEIPGYEFTFHARVGKRLLLGRVVVLPSLAPGARDGVVLRMLATPAAGLSKPDEVGIVGLTKRPFRTFRFGTEGP